jgi:hypothetical protein
MTQQINPEAIMRRLRALLGALEHELSGPVSIRVVIHRDGGRVTFDVGEPLDRSLDPS